MTIAVQLKKVAAEIVQSLATEGERAREEKAAPMEESEWRLGNESQVTMSHYLDAIINKAMDSKARHRSYSPEHKPHDCPWCWIVKGRQATLLVVPHLQRTLKCDLCGSRFPVGGRAGE